MEYDILDYVFMWLVDQIGWFGVIYLIALIPIGHAMWDYKKVKRINILFTFLLSRLKLRIGM